MADLKDRTRAENGFSSRLNRVLVKHRKEAEEIMGTPADPSKLSSGYWDSLEKETREELYAVILRIFLLSYTQHWPGSFPGDSREKGTSSAKGYAEKRSRTIASQFVQHTKERLARIEDIPKGDDPPAPEGDAPPARQSEHSKKTRSILKSTLGQDRADRIAVSETTAAVSKGGESAIQETVGWSENDTWFTKADGRVCPVCVPLHRNKRSEWSKPYPAGPPAHINCRCWIDYEAKVSGDKTGKQGFIGGK